MEKLLQCQKDMLLTPKYDSEYQTIDYICRPKDSNRHAIFLNCSDVETLDDIFTMNEKVLDSFIQQVCGRCPCNGTLGK